MIYRIHPAIGIARVGNSEEFYLAPEQAGGLPSLPDGQPFGPTDFRDSGRHLRRQAARFQVYRYDERRPDDPGLPVRPGEDGVEHVKWTVHLANKKPIWYRFMTTRGESGYAPDHPLRNPEIVDPRLRTTLMIDPGPRTLRGASQSVELSRWDNPLDYPMTFPARGLQPHDIDSLGTLCTDEDERLMVLGGYGRSGSNRQPPRVADDINNDGWWDDTSDGPVTATVMMSDGREIEVAGGAWVVVGPPRFAPQLVNLVTLYDVMLDTAVRFLNLRPDMYAHGRWSRDYRPSWEGEIKPILDRANGYPWVVAVPKRPHRFDLDSLGDPSPEHNGDREYYLRLIRSPDEANVLRSPDTGLPMMPLLCGDDCFERSGAPSRYLTITATQRFLLEQWAAGRFTVDRPPRAGRGAALDRAALENCVGGSLSPGMEVTWISRNPQIYAEPFRIRHKVHPQPPLSLGERLADGLEPGDLTKRMALPWQADFNECTHERIDDNIIWWWPVQRPNFVYVNEGGRLRRVPWVETDAEHRAAKDPEFPDNLDMVKLWQDLGFVFNEGTESEPRFLEVERVRERAPRGSDEQSSAD